MFRPKEPSTNIIYGKHNTLLTATYINALNLKKKKHQTLSRAYTYDEYKNIWY